MMVKGVSPRFSQAAVTYKRPSRFHEGGLITSPFAHLTDTAFMDGFVKEHPAGGQRLVTFIDDVARQLPDNTTITVDLQNRGPLEESWIVGGNIEVTLPDGEGSFTHRISAPPLLPRWMERCLSTGGRAVKWPELSSFFDLVTRSAERN